MANTKIRQLVLENFGPFVGRHEIQLPESGLTLVRGKVSETGDSSGAGKTSFLNAISYLFGGCPFASTELQSWYTEEEPRAEAVLEVDGGEVRIVRHKGLIIKSPKYPKGVRGKAAEAALDEMFGMDEKTRSICTYRGQKQPGVFLKMSDAQKKQFLSSLLDLDKYERVAMEAAEKAKDLKVTVSNSKARLEMAQETFGAAQTRLSSVYSPDVLNREKFMAEMQGMVSSVNELEARVAMENKLAQDVRSRLNADMGAEIEILRSALRNTLNTSPLENSYEIKKIEEEVVVLGNKIAYLQKEDQLMLLSVEKERGRLNAELVKLKASVSDLPRLKRCLEDLSKQRVALESQICPTCTRTWICDESQKLLNECVGEIEEISLQITTKSSEIPKGLEIKRLIESLVVPEANPNIINLVQRKDVLVKQIRELNQKNLEEVREIESTFRGKGDLVRTRYLTMIEEQSAAHTTQSAKYLQEARNKRGQLDSIRKHISDLELRAAQYDECSRSVATAAEAVDKAQVSLAEVTLALSLESDVQALVGREGFLGVIFDDVLAEIAASTNRILERVANVSHLVFQFDSTKESRNGNVIQRIIPVIYSHERKVSFDAGISGGMQTSVELAVDLAVAEVVARRRGTYPGFLILDEPFEGLGGTSKEAALEMLRSYSEDKLILVVDHSSEIGASFSQVIEIVQEDGRSRISS
jgi:DNA repair exonuclease SbcCD ATPase subunit